MHSTEQLAELRRSIAAGSYDPDSRAVATAIVRTLVEVGRMRRALGDSRSPLGEVLEARSGPYSPVRPA
jgi:Anti-sigma-28 factor, FlgM